MWSRVNDYPCTDPLFTVTNLPENSEWEFRVMAVNAAGNSDPACAHHHTKSKRKLMCSHTITSFHFMHFDYFNSFFLSSELFFFFLQLVQLQNLSRNRRIPRHH